LRGGPTAVTFVIFGMNVPWVKRFTKKKELRDTPCGVSWACGNKLDLNGQTRCLSQKKSKDALWRMRERQRAGVATQSEVRTQGNHTKVKTSPKKGNGNDKPRTTRTTKNKTTKMGFQKKKEVGGWYQKIKKETSGKAFVGETLGRVAEEDAQIHKRNFGFPKKGDGTIWG